MTAKDLKTKRGLSFKYFSHSLRSYWWLGVIAGIAYGIAGPLALWMGLASMNNDAAEALPMRYIQAVNEWFHMVGLISYYIIAMFLAVVFALVIWSYLHSKKQSNFYHSMPISRPALFINNTLVGIAINFIPLIIMYGLMILVGISYAGASAINWGWIVVHLLRMFLFFMLSYSLAVLAAQLTGTVLTQLGMSAVLHFGLMAFLAVGILAMQTFLSTFDGNAAFDKVWYLSPLTNFVYWVSTEQSVRLEGLYQTVDGLGVKWTLTILVITIAAFALAFYAYQKRHSEKAGQALLFDFTKPIVEFILMFCIATLAANAFLEISGKFFFLVGLVLFAVLTHMFCQVIFNKDFKAMFAAKKYLIGFLAVLLLFFGGMYTDILGYNDYVPASEKISAIKIDLSEFDRYGNNNYGEDANIYTDGNDIELLLSIANQITDKGYYWRNSRLYGNELLEGMDSERVTLSYTYITSSGREIHRSYNSVPIDAFKADFTALYNRDSFKQVNYAWLINAKVRELSYFGVDSLNRTIYQQREVSAKLPYDYRWENDNNQFQAHYGEELLNALKQDIMNRKTSDLLEAPLYSISLEFKVSPEDDYSYNTRYRYYDVSVYPSDTFTLEVLAQLEAEGLFVTTDYAYLAENIGSLDIYQVDIERVGSMESVLYGSYQYKDDVTELEPSLVKMQTVTDKAEIARILALAINERQAERMSVFKDIREDIFIGLTFSNVVGSSSRWDMGLVLPSGAEI